MRVVFLILFNVLCFSLFSSAQISTIDKFDGEIQAHNAKIVTFESLENMTIRIFGLSDVAQSERIVLRVFLEDNIILWENFEPYNVYLEVLLTRFFDLNFLLDVPSNTTVHFAFINFYPKVVTMEFNVEVIEIHTSESPNNFLLSVFGISFLLVLRRRIYKK